MKRKDGPPGGSALPRTLSIALLVVAAILLASSLDAAPFSQEGTANLNHERPVTAPVAAQSSRLGQDGALRLVRISTNSPRTSQPRELSLADRCAYQRAIEEVYWRHRIWPKERPDPKPSLGEVMGPGQIEQKVENSLRNCRVLEEYWMPIRAAQLQEEMNRMARDTEQPEVLRELFGALRNDPFVIAECLAKPVLAERLMSKLPQEQRVPGELMPRRADRREKESPMAASAPGYALPAISGKPGGLAKGTGNAPRIATKISVGSGADSCEDDTWTATYAPPFARESQTAIWTGAEMIIWGGVVNTGLTNTGARYNPSTDSWTATTITSAPAERYFHTAVWTGTEMIIWGGYDRDVNLNTGGRYNPGTDSWTATSLTNAPTARSAHTAVWTGTEMIVWGGNDHTGGRYDPETDSWTATSQTNAPTTGSFHTAVWTGTEMIVWGGYEGPGYLNTGGRYNPETDSWTATSATNAPLGRSAHTAVWTGSEMIVWGGGGDKFSLSNTGGKYNPSTDSWTTTSTNVTGRDYHLAVWTGTEMIVWGGHDQTGYSNTGGRYNPGTDSWTTINSTNAPTPREGPTAVWTGTEMIVWGGWYNGYFNTGGKYNSGTDSWAATSTTNVPDGRYYHTALWTGTEMIIWGGAPYVSAGGRYDPATDSWTTTSISNAPAGRERHSAVWTGTEMIVWGGHRFFAPVNTGGRYNPGTDSWSPTSTTNAPTARYSHAEIWTGTEMIVWGGNDSSFNTGGRYDPSTDSWTATSTINAPPARGRPAVVWTGTEMIVWGGSVSSSTYSNEGRKYDPGKNRWTPISSTNAPAGRASHTAVWTGTEMIVWGGYGNAGYLNTGARYSPGTDSWTAISITNAPTARDEHTAVWTGREMIVWGGFSAASNENTGARYDPSSDSWRAINITNAPPVRLAPSVIWAGSQMIVWGGYANNGFWNTGERYCAQAGPTTLANISTRLRVEVGNSAGIGGFIITGTEAKKLMVRAVGPSLPLPGNLPDPILELRNSSGELIRANDNWRSDQEPEIIATGIPPNDDLESAIVETLPANGSAYSAIVRGANNGTGIGLVEVYDLERTVDSKLANISTRGHVGTDDNVMIGGMIVQGGLSSGVILRGIGPSLATAGVPDVLADPTLELRNVDGVLLGTNDNWQDDSASAAQLIAYGLAPQPLESGIFVSLAPGAYTAILVGRDNGTGVGLVEAYQVQ